MKRWVWPGIGCTAGYSTSDSVSASDARRKLASRPQRPRKVLIGCPMSLFMRQQAVQPLNQARDVQPVLDFELLFPLRCVPAFALGKVDKGCDRQSAHVFWSDG